MSALALAADRSGFAQSINGHIRVGLDSWYCAALELIAAKHSLRAGEFTAMLDNDLIISADLARHLMKMPLHPRIRDLANLAETDELKLLPNSPKLPKCLDVADALLDMREEQYEAAVAQGMVREDTTIAEIRAFIRQFRADNPHRPDAARRCLPPAAPAHGDIATRREEVLWLAIAARKALGVSQNEIDARVNWSDALTSKYENPTHDNDGKTITLDALLEYLSAIKHGLKVAAL